MSNSEPKTLFQLLRQLDEQGITDHRRYAAVKRFLNFKAREKLTPVSGSFELTPLCNLDCKMCYVHLNREQLRGAELLTTDQWKQLMKQAVDAGMMYAALTGGECLTYPGFKELYLYLRSMGVETSILSNGILMDTEMVEFLKENPPSYIQISLYGASEEAYERVTGQRRFNTVVENLKRIRDAGLPLTAAVTPNAFMEDGEDILRLLHDLAIPFRINSGLIAPREETGRDTLEADLDTYVKLMRLQRTLKGKDILPECDPESLPDVGGTGESQKGVRCGAGRSGFSIGWDGNMRPCNGFPCEPAHPLETGFMDAWRKLNAIARDFPLPIECSGCKYESACKHCVAEHASGAPIGHASPAICAWGRRMAAEGLIRIEV